MAGYTIRPDGLGAKRRRGPVPAWSALREAWPRPC